MLPRSLLVTILASAPLLSQSNAVPGMDARVYNVTDIAYYGRQGAAWPNGEAGFMIGHSYCNAGGVDIPWVATSGGVMVDTYPKIAFLLARESNGRMVQVSGPGYCKHSTAVFNFASGPCAPCQPGAGFLFRRGCSDTYGSGTNANQMNLGPTSEINPWLGTWPSVGSYFDIGAPGQAGYPLPADGVKSLSTSGFGQVRSRIVVRESELEAGATYHGQVHLMIQGEPVANRANNVQSRPMSIAWGGSSWSAAALGDASDGSVLTKWTGATHEIAGNGNDDGRFLVAVKVTGPLLGMYRYEYAIHNLDNHRGGASLRIPVDAGAVVQNAGFHDIDGNPLNDWTFSRTPTEIAFTAPAGNALDWNTIYNCWFECSKAPSYGMVDIDQARLGAGALSVQVGSDVPSGIPTARIQKVGTGCGSCSSAVYEYWSNPGFDLANRAMTMTLNTGAYTVQEVPVSFAPVTGTVLPMSDDTEVVVALPFTLPYPGGSTTQLRVCSNGFISPAASPGTGWTPTASAFLNGPPRWAAAWHDFHPNATGQVLVDSSPSLVTVSWSNVPNRGTTDQNTFQFQFLPNGTVHILWGAMAAAGNSYLVGWTPGAVGQDPGGRDFSATLPVPYQLCAGYFTGMDLDVDARPVLGTTIEWTTSNIPAGTPFGALLLSLTWLNPPVDLSGIGMPGCQAHLDNWFAESFLAPPTSVQHTLTIPNDNALISVILVSQAATYSPPLTPFGYIVSNGIVLTLGL